MSNDTLIKSDARGYVIDKDSGAILNTDENEYALFLAERNKAKEIRALTARVASLENEVIQLKKIINEKFNG